MRRRQAIKNKSENNLRPNRVDGAMKGKEENDFLLLFSFTGAIDWEKCLAVWAEYPKIIASEEEVSESKLMAKPIFVGLIPRYPGSITY